MMCLCTNAPSGEDADGGGGVCGKACTFHSSCGSQAILKIRSVMGGGLNAGEIKPVAGDVGCGVMSGTSL